MSDDVHGFLSHYSPEVRVLALKLRELILSLVPYAQEKVYSGWKTIGYSCGGGMKGQFCAIGPQQGRVNLYFSRGVDLDDPGGLLEGSGKKMRHLKIRAPEDVQAEALKRLIIAAAARARSQP